MAVICNHSGRDGLAIIQVSHKEKKERERKEGKGRESKRKKRRKMDHNRGKERKEIQKGRQGRLGEEVQGHSLTPPSGQQETAQQAPRGGWIVFLEGCHSGLRNDSRQSPGKEALNQQRCKRLVQSQLVDSPLLCAQLSRDHSKDQRGRKTHT